MLLSDIQQSSSIIHIHVSFFFFKFTSYSGCYIYIEQSFLCYKVGLWEPLNMNVGTLDIVPDVSYMHIILKKFFFPFYIHLW